LWLVIIVDTKWQYLLRYSMPIGVSSIIKSKEATLMYYLIAIINNGEAEEVISTGLLRLGNFGWRRSTLRGVEPV